MNIVKSKRISFLKRNIREVKFLLSIMLLMYCGSLQAQDKLILLMEEQTGFSSQTWFYCGLGNELDLKLIEKGQSYDILKTSYVIFICTFDFFEKNRSIYEFENICVDDSDIKLNDGTHKIFLNTKGNRDGISEELQMLLDYFDGREPESQLAKDIDRKVFEARNNKQWRREYMSYQMELDKQYRNGREEGMAEGREEGMDNISKLLKLLVSEKKYDEIEKISEDKEYQMELLKKYKIIE